MGPYGDSTVYFSRTGDRHLGYMKKLHRSYVGAGDAQLTTSSICTRTLKSEPLVVEFALHLMTRRAVGGAFWWAPTAVGVQRGGVGGAGREQLQARCAGP
jgi:hypothetical protein